MNDSDDNEVCEQVTLKSKVLSAVEFQFLEILNRGSHSDLIQLKDIGTKRADAILSLRSLGKYIENIEDLKAIGMTSKTIMKCFKKNLDYIIGFDL